MSIIGKVDSLWRYPVKSMRGEELDQVFAGLSGIYGDRLFAFRSSASREDFPFFTGRDQRQMIRYRPRFRGPEKAARPIDPAEVQSTAPGASSLSAGPTDMMIDVEPPNGEAVAIDDPALIGMLRSGIDEKHHLKLMRSERAMTDCRPISLFSLQSARQLGEEIGTPIDKRRFRANVYLDLTSNEGLMEDSLVGRSVRIGPKVVISILERDPRCMMITLDPDTAEKTPAILKKVTQAHEGMAGVYGTVLVEGMLRKGDSVEVLE